MLLLLGSCTYSGCNREKPVPLFSLPEEIKAWGYFKPGSWWLYQEDSTGIRDCVWVSSAGIQYNEDWNDGKLTSRYETGSVALQTSTSNSVIDYQIRERNFFLRQVWAEQKIDFQFSLFSYNDNNEIFFNGNVFSFTSCQINNTSYNNVKRVNSNIKFSVLVNNIYTYSYHECEFWLAKNQGFLKKILRTPVDTTYWSIINYHIEQ